MSTKSLVLLIVLSGLLSSCVTTTEKGTGKIDERVMWYERIWEMGEPITGSKIVDSCRSIKECEDNTEPKTPRDGVTNLSSQCADTIAASKCIGAIHSFEKLEDRSYSELMSLRDFIGFFVNWSANHQERLQRTWSEAVRLAFYDSWNVSSDQSLKKSISSQSGSKAKDIIYK